METSAPQAAPAAESASPEASETQESTNTAPEEGGEVAALENAAQNGTPSQKAVAKKMLKSIKIKYNGREMEEELPFEIPDDEPSIEFMRNKLQMGKLAQTKAQEYSTLEKQARTFIEELRKNPRKVLGDPNVGVDIKQLARDIIEEEIANSQKTPEQLAKDKLEAELKSLKEEREKEKKDFEQKEFERITQQAHDHYEMQISTALEKGDLPKTPYVVKKIADYLMMGIKNNLDVSPEDVIPLVKDEMHNDLKQMFAVMPEDVIESLVGKDVINKIRKKSIAKAKTAPIPVKSQLKDVGAAKSTAKGPEPKKLSFKQFFGV